MKHKVLICIALFLLIGGCNFNNPDDEDPEADDPVIETGTVTDIDGNEYQTVKIGDQWWMAENLKVTRFRDGSSISNITDATEWRDTFYEGTPAYCIYNNDSDYLIPYGLLYNWFVVNDERFIAPEGWHVPSYEEWEVLIEYLGGSGVAGGKLKEAGTEHWITPNEGATNSSGFNALPSGSRYGEDFDNMGESSYFWTATIWDEETAYVRGVRYISEGIATGLWALAAGGPIRCIKDQ